jgi:hypothetical protein
MQKSHDRLVDDIKLNNEDFVKFVETTGSMVEESVSGKLRADVMKVFNVRSSALSLLQLFFLN